MVVPNYRKAGILSDPDDQSIVILTGAGISKESGLDTFRDPGGIWSQVRIEDVATPKAYARDPARVQPLGPSSATNSPRCMVRLTPSST